MTKLEQIARLIDPSMWSDHDYVVGQVSAQGADRRLLDAHAVTLLDSKRKAKAVLMIIREPSAAMIAAGDALILSPGTMSGADCDVNPMPKDAWRAMIDARPERGPGLS